MANLKSPAWVILAISFIGVAAKVRESGINKESILLAVVAIILSLCFKLLWKHIDKIWVQLILAVLGIGFIVPLYYEYWIRPLLAKESEGTKERTNANSGVTEENFSSDGSVFIIGKTKLGPSSPPLK